MLPLLEKIIAVKKPVSGLPKSLLAQYEAIGTASTFRVEPIEKGLIFIGKTAKVALKVEFGNRWEFFNTITALRETDADIKVLVTSSNSKAMSLETVYTVLKKKLEEKKRWVLIDLEGKKETMLLNFSHSDMGARNTARPPEARKRGAAKAPGPAHRPQEQQAPATQPQKPEETPAQAQKKGPLSFLKRLPFIGSRAKGGEEPVKMKKTKNYGMQPVNAKPRRKKIYGKRRKKQD